MLDVVKKAMQLEEKDKDPEIKRDAEKLSYNYGSLRTLKYIIDSSLIPNDRRTELMRMYRDSLENYFNESGDNEITKILKIETEGASDILAWLLEIPDDQHVQNKNGGKIMNE